MGDEKKLSIREKSKRATRRYLGLHWCKENGEDSWIFINYMLRYESGYKAGLRAKELREE